MVIKKPVKKPVAKAAPAAKVVKASLPPFVCESIIKRTKGKMVMLYAVVGGTEEHMASFFHDNKAEYIIASLEAQGVKVKREK